MQDQAAQAQPRVTSPQRVFYAVVLAFAAWVALWGLFLPGKVDGAIPFMVPPLHARFLGVMYLSGVALLILGIRALWWSEVRVMTAMLSVWTGTLGIVSFFHLGAFNFARPQSWFWFFAYIVFPLIALWIVWRERGKGGPPLGPPISGALRAYLTAQGVVASLVAICLLIAPAYMTTVWPWRIPLVVAHIYGAPFLSYGFGSFYATRQKTWGEVRIVLCGTLVFTLGVFVVSKLHAATFFHGPGTWVWFGGFGLASLALLLFLGLHPKNRTEPN